MKVRFLADADLNKAIVAGLRGMKDPEVLALVSHDAGTMPGHFRRSREAGKSNCGVFLIPQSLEVGVAIEQSAGVAAVLSPAPGTMFTYPRHADVDRLVLKAKNLRLRLAQPCDSESVRLAGSIGSRSSRRKP